MKRFVLLVALAALHAGASALAAALAVGSIADDVGFSEGRALEGGVYSDLEQRRLSSFRDKVTVLVYFTPW